MEKVLVEEIRGNTVECVHRGHICGVSYDRKVKYVVGDADYMAYLRSAGKPIQAIPGVKHGIIEKYNLSDKEAAIMTGSHRAESFHVEALESMAKKIGLVEDALVCMPTLPLGEASREQVIREGSGKKRIYHNCSGKHYGVLALCKAMGYSLEDYFEPEHPAQQEILETLAMLAEYPKEQIVLGTDGCGFPVFALPLNHLAIAYLKLARPELIADREVREAVITITKLMNENYEMVAGTDRICSSLLRDSNIVAKGGAKGVYCFSLRDEGLSFALKVLDGSEDEWTLIVATILEQINYKNKETIRRLYEEFPVEIKNDNQRIVGKSKAVFTLETV